MSPLALILLACLVWLAIGLLGATFSRRFVFVTRVLFPAGALVAATVALTALLALLTQGDTPHTATLPLGLPGLPFHLRLDALSALFLILLGAVAAGISIYAAGYFRRGQGSTPGLQCLLYHLFLASMGGVLLADDAYFFMVAWESMALSSYFLVTSDHRIAEIRRAGFLYLIVAHVGAIGILLSFGAMSGGTGDYTFDGIRTNAPEGWLASAAFLLALGGFGAKAGLLPLHVWLPEAHPAAPSPVSAMMSGVMLKTAIYGLLRVTFDLLPEQQWWWGALLLGLGLATALFGVVFSTVQSDMKRLLAYSSIENIGLIFAGIGLSLVFAANSMPLLAALALTAALYHCLNHAFFKSLLFLATGSVLHATGQRNLGRLGGLIHRMPWVAWLALLGVVASAGLPPLNGFVSEWLLLQSFLFTPQLPHGYLNMLLPVAAGAIALIAALAGFAMVKFFGVVFLGQPREEHLAKAHDAGRMERLGLIWLAAGCVLLGVLPNFVIAALDPVTNFLVGAGFAPAADKGSWLLLAPISEERASYSGAIFLGGLLAFTLALFFVVRAVFHGRLRRADAWDCGFPLLSGRTQDTAEGFGQPIRQVFAPFFRITREHPSPFDKEPHYRIVVDDPLWHWLYLPLAWLVDLGTRVVGKLQRGRIAIYLLYSFVTLLALLVFTTR
ncbi:hydrogenase 4 subunit B [Rhodocyclus tenuis]|uniref:Hydrogenase 4 subunit B n=1 Tax=Rhodocyclus gracilis TaxID=2929842 RepID=A0ABX0WFE8_9RHOO|nr:hydrogenase 4 subunit B [Rhodocyclus gracilis]NJA88254.1 hydrogenase 4 subunit B [Rhodocyclus gracilis]